MKDFLIFLVKRHPTKFRERDLGQTSTIHGKYIKSAWILIEFTKAVTIKPIKKLGVWVLLFTRELNLKKSIFQFNVLPFCYLFSTQKMLKSKLSMEMSRIIILKKKTIKNEENLSRVGLFFLHKIQVKNEVWSNFSS